MRFIEIIGSLQLPLSNEEAEVFDKVSSSDRGMIERETLTLREREVARKMVSRGALNRARTGDTVFYLLNVNDSNGDTNE